MFQNTKLKRNATLAIAEVADVALCASNCALPTSVNYNLNTDLVEDRSWPANDFRFN